MKKKICFIVLMGLVLCGGCESPNYDTLPNELENESAVILGDLGLSEFKEAQTEEIPIEHVME